MHDDAYLVDFGGSYVNGWVDKKLVNTQEGDLQGLERMEAYLSMICMIPVQITLTCGTFLVPEICSCGPVQKEYLHHSQGFKGNPVALRIFVLLRASILLRRRHKQNSEML